MARRHVAHVNLTPNNHYSLNDKNNVRSLTIYPEPKTNLLNLKIYKTKHNKTDCGYIDIGLSDTIKVLKEKIALYLPINVPIKDFFLEVFDENDKQWKVIDESNPSTTINHLKLRSGCTLAIGYRTQETPKDQHLLSSTSVSENSRELLLKICRIPMDRTHYTNIYINSLCTLRKLRKEVYVILNKLPKNQPLFRWNKDGWTKFESDMDDKTLDNLSFESYTFISTDFDEENFSSKVPLGLCGLSNLGSTCFMNSVFQCLNYIPKFIKSILELNDEVNAPIISEYRKLIKKMWSGKYTVINPSLLLENIQDNLPHYESYRQQDAHEFMDHFLHLIHAEFSMKNTLITDLFYGQFRSTVKCLECQQIEITNEPFTFLPLSIMNYNQMYVLYAKVDGEQRLVSIQVDSSVITFRDLIDCFIKQYEPKLTSERIRAVRLVNNIIDQLYEPWNSIHDVNEEELAFLERPEKTTHEKYMRCEFIDSTTGEAFRPPTVLFCPDQKCSYLHLSDQIDQLLGHLCSMTHAPVSACQIYWIDRKKRRYKLNIETDTDEELPCILTINIAMASKWVDIYKTQYNTKDSTNNSILNRLLADFFREDYLDGDYHCLKCSKSSIAQRKSELCLPLPHVLVIQLKRFAYDNYSNKKINTYISFPLHELDLNEYIVKDGNNDAEKISSTNYDLVAVSNHTGSLMSGHYTTFAKNFRDENWYLFDDQFVRKIDSDKNIVTKNAYILVYVQRTQ
ncbi:unnamed protein product [Rotaria sp. Silwood1]|nr:unnamed protein product [Rotaria sp. Silwood1]